MIRRTLGTLTCAVLLCAFASAHAQTLATIVFDTPHHYAGPGDTAPYTAWYGLRAYSTAVAATGTQKSLDLRRVSDNATCTALIATSGSIDLTVGTPCNGGTQTVTAWIGASTARVSKMYDQTAGNACGGASCDLVQATAGNQPTLFLTGGGGGGTLPYIHVLSQTNGQLESANNFTPNAAALMSLSVVGIRDSTTSTSSFITANNNVNNVIQAVGANVWSSNVTATASDNNWHAGNVIKNTVVASSIFNLDGTETAGTGSFTATAGHIIVQDTVGTNAGLGFGEGGFQDNTNWSSGTRTALCHNQRLYWGTGGSC